MNEPKSSKATLRCEKILQAALELFAKNGYEKTSLNDIVELSGGSLSTIYKYFGDKQTLLYTILETEIQNFNERVKSEFEINENLAIKEFLLKFGEMFLNTVFDEKSYILIKIAFNESCKNGEKIANFFKDHDLRKLDKFLADFFASHSDEINGQNYDIMAKCFISMIRGEFEAETIVFGRNLNEIKKEKMQNLNEVVEIFLRGILK